MDRPKIHGEHSGGTAAGSSDAMYGAEHLLAYEVCSFSILPIFFLFSF